MESINLLQIQSMIQVVFSMMKNIHYFRQIEIDSKTVILESQWGLTTLEMAMQVFTPLMVNMAWSIPKVKLS